MLGLAVRALRVEGGPHACRILNARDAALLCTADLTIYLSGQLGIRVMNWRDPLTVAELWSKNVARLAGIVLGGSSDLCDGRGSCGKLKRLSRAPDGERRCR